MNEFLRNAQIFLQNIGWRDVLDVVIVAVLLYQLLKLFRGSQAFQILLGLGVVVVVGLIAQILQLRLLEYLYSNGLQALLIAIIVLFQPEFRRALDQIGRFGGFRRVHVANHEVLVAIDNVVDAIAELQRHKWGALIVFERSTKIENVISTGVTVDAGCTNEMLLSLFYPGSPLHDGAVIIRDFRLFAAGCVLPLAERSSKAGTRRLGTRHRAALGLSLVSDAYIIVVSEETGELSTAVDGALSTNVEVKAMRRLLLDSLGFTDLARPRKASTRQPVPIVADPTEHHHVAH